VFGELALSGESPAYSFVERRVAEASKMGFEAAIGPEIRTGKTTALNFRLKMSVALLNTAFLENNLPGPTMRRCSAVCIANGDSAAYGAEATLTWQPLLAGDGFHPHYPFTVNGAVPPSS